MKLRSYSSCIVDLREKLRVADNMSALILVRWSRGQVAQLARFVDGKNTCLSGLCDVSH